MQTATVQATATGDPNILDILDAEHETIREMLETLKEALSQGDESLSQAVFDLAVETCRRHFMHEEELFEACDDIAAKRHRLAHSALLKQLEHGGLTKRKVAQWYAEMTAHIEALDRPAYERTALRVQMCEPRRSSASSGEGPQLSIRPEYTPADDPALPRLGIDLVRST